MILFPSADVPFLFCLPDRGPSFSPDSSEAKDELDSSVFSGVSNCRCGFFGFYAIVTFLVRLLSNQFG